MIRRWLLPVLMVVIGLQLLRVFIPSLAWYLRDTVGLSSLSLAPYAGGTFLVAFLAAPLRRAVGSRSALRLSVVGAAALRLLEQLSTDPQLDLWLSIAGLAMFLLFLPLFLGHVRATVAPAAALWGFGVPLGIAVDIALHGASGTLDLSWIGGPFPIAVIAVLAALVAWSVWSYGPADGPSEVDWPAALPLIAIGPLLLLQLLLLQSSGWVEEVAGLGSPLGFAVVMLGNLALIVGVRQALLGTGRRARLLGLGATLYLALAVYYADAPGLPFLATLVLSQLVLGWGWGVISRRAAPPTRPGLARTGIALPLGTLLFLALAFVYYVALNLALPFPRSWVLPVSGVLFGLLIVAAAPANVQARRAGGQLASAGSGTATDARAPDGHPSSASDAQLPIRAALALLLVPWIAWLVRGPLPEAQVAEAAPLRVMTYNIHSGFGAAGRHSPEAIARVIEESGAGIVALQEVSRVRLLDGGTDLAVWLARRLDYPFIFRGAEEPIWGNAILSRYPFIRSGSADLPREGALIGRGYLWAEIDVGFPLLVINAHLHHIEGDHHIRLVEVPVLLDFWDGRPNTVLLGDLNAEPHYPEMALPAEAGLIDAWGESGSGDGYTWSAAEPDKRIDWIWHSPDLRAYGVTVLSSQASDHLPVVADIDQAP